MADVTLSTPALVTTMGNNRYILGDADSGRASQFAIQIDLNGGAATYAFYVRVSPETAWAAAMAYPVSTPTTGATSGATSNVWMLDASGKQVSLDVSGTSGSPQLTYLPLVG